MKTISKLLLCASLVVGLTACGSEKPSTYPIYPDNNKEVETPLFEVPDTFKVISFDEAESHWNDDKTVMVYSFTDCPHCAVVIPLLDEIESEAKTDTKYIYVDVTRNERENGNEVYDKTVEHFTDYLGEDQKMYVPFTVYLNDGEIIAAHIGDEGIDNTSIKETLTLYLNRLTNA
ncbi:MAG: thioredoxin family protein [Erysipelotrichaceae bacterium]|nr:thioredoxin family protein [Erysipelotrichaceae bacterium]